MLYKTVAFNNAKDAGNFWTMKFTDTCMSTYCEQPPLYSYLLGRVYALFGSSYLIDRFFTLGLCILLLLVLKRIFAKLRAMSNSYFLLTLFFLLSISVVCWSYANQVIEPLVLVFTGLGILFFIDYVFNNKKFSIVLFALSIYLSFLTKGFQSCFLIVLPLTYFLLDRFSKRQLYFLLFSGLLTCTLIFGTLHFYKPAANWYDCYYKARLVLTMNNVGNTTDNHFEIIVRFFTELLVPIAAVLMVLLFLRIKKKYPLVLALKNFISNKLALALFITSFAGSFPYAISLVQRGFYLIPSFICFVLALVIGFRRYWLFVVVGLHKLSKSRAVSYVVIAVFVAVMSYSLVVVSDYKRDHTLIEDLKIISPYLKNNSVISVEKDMWNYFSLHSYLYMQKGVSLSTDPASEFLIHSKFSDTALLPAGFVDMQLPTEELNLAIRISGTKTPH